MIRVAVVGAGQIGHTHCRFYKRNPHTELVSVCDLQVERVQSMAETYGVKGYTDMKDMLEQEKIDVVIVATAGEEKGSHHYTPVMLAIEAGKDVLVEKPISNQIEEAREMVRFAREKGVRLACNLNHRFTPAAHKAKQLIEENKIGTQLYANMKLTIRNHADDTEWFHIRALHPHSIDVLRYLSGEISKVQAFMTKAPGRKTWSTISINLVFASGAVGHLTGSYDMSVRHPIEHCEIAGDAGRIEIDNVFESMTYYPHDQDELLVLRNPILGGMQGFDDTFRLRIERWIEQIRAGVSPDEIEASGADALAAQEVIEAAIRSHMNGGAVVEIPSS